LRGTTYSMTVPCIQDMDEILFPCSSEIPHLHCQLRICARLSPRFDRGTELNRSLCSPERLGGRDVSILPMLIEEISGGQQENTHPQHSNHSQPHSHQHASTFQSRMRAVPCVATPMAVGGAPELQGNLTRNLIMLAIVLLYAAGSLFFLLFMAWLAVTVYIYLVHRRCAHIPSPKMPR